MCFLKMAGNYSVDIVTAGETVKYCYFSLWTCIADVFVRISLQISQLTMTESFLWKLTEPSSNFYERFAKHFLERI